MKEKAQLMEGIEEYRRMIGYWSDDHEDDGIDFIDLFYGSMVVNPLIGSVTFHSMSPYTECSHRFDLTLKIDLLLTDDDRVGIVEVREQVKIGDIERIHTEMMPLFKYFYRKIYAGRDVYVALATDAIPSDASERGRFLARLDQLGYGLMVADIDEMKVVCHREAMPKKIGDHVGEDFVEELLFGNSEIVTIRKLAVEMDISVVTCYEMASKIISSDTQRFDLARTRGRSNIILTQQEVEEIRDNIRIKQHIDNLRKQGIPVMEGLAKLFT